MSERNITKQEADFWEWWEKIEPYMDQYTLRMAFDAGYEAAKEDK